MDTFTLTGGALEPIVGWIRGNPQSAFLVFAALLLAMLLWLLTLTVRLDKMQRRQRRLLRGADGASLETMLMEHVAEREALRAQLERNEAGALANTNALTGTIQRIGLVRHDAFEDIGGHQSFALALMDAQQSGVVLSALVSRSEVRVYAKTVAQGQASQKLSDEEARAIRGATGGGTPFLEM